MQHSNVASRVGILRRGPLQTAVVDVCTEYRRRQVVDLRENGVYFRAPCPVFCAWCDSPRSWEAVRVASVDMKMGP